MTTEAETAPEALEQGFELEAAPAQVWRALTEADLLARWLLPAGEAGRNRAAPGNICCEPLDAEPGVRVSYRWRDGALDSVVTFSIAAMEAGGTRLRITQTRMLAPASLQGVAGILRFGRRPAATPLRLRAANLNRSPALLAA